MAYVGIGDDVKKEQLRQAKLRAIAEGQVSDGSEDDELPGGSVDLPAVGRVPVLAIAAGAAAVGYVVWMKKRKKG